MGGRPEYRRFGFVDFDALGSAPAGDLELTDEIVIRRNGGDNEIATISQLPFTTIPDPLLLGDGTAAAPTYSYASDPDTGVFRSAANVLGFSAGGTEIADIDATSIRANHPNGPALINAAGTNSAPNVRANRADADTGMYSRTADELNFAVGALNAFFLSEIGNGAIPGWGNLTGITAFAGGGQGSATALVWGYNVVTTVATAGDSVRLPSSFQKGATVWIKNEGANAMDVFPASGDNLGAGVDTAVSVAAGESAAFQATVNNSTWYQFDFGSVPDPLLLSDGTAAAPTYSFASEATTGIFLPALNNIGFSLTGVHAMTMDDTGLFSAQVANSGYLVADAAPSATIPVHTFASDNDTGLGTAGADILSFIAGGVQAGQAFETGGVAQMLAVAGTATAPGWSFIGDPNTGFHNPAADRIGITLGGTQRWLLIGQTLGGAVVGSAAITNVIPTATTPSIFPRGNDGDTGIGSVAVDNLSLIAGGLEAVRIEDPADLVAGETSLWVFDDDNNVLEQVTVGAADSGGLGFKVLRIPN